MDVKSCVFTASVSQSNTAECFVKFKYSVSIDFMLLFFVSPVFPLID